MLYIQLYITNKLDVNSCGENDGYQTAIFPCKGQILPKAIENLYIR